MPSQKDMIERLSNENASLKATVDSLTERITSLEQSFKELSSNQVESFARVEAVEENLCTVASEQKELEKDQASLLLRVEQQQQYSRKQTLLLSGPAVQMPTRGENIRGVVLGLIANYLDITDLSQKDICACHRLGNQKTILVRFVDMRNSDRVYRSRVKPKRQGLHVFESLTSERLAVVNMIRTLKESQDSPILSYFTQSGKVCVITSQNQKVEIPFGAQMSDIRALCEGRAFVPTPTAVRDQFRAIEAADKEKRHSTQGRFAQGPSPQVQRGDSEWIVVPRGRRRGAGRGPESSGAAGGVVNRVVRETSGTAVDTVGAVPAPRGQSRAEVGDEGSVASGPAMAPGVSDARNSVSAPDHGNADGAVAESPPLNRDEGSPGSSGLGADSASVTVNTASDRTQQ